MRTVSARAWAAGAAASMAVQHARALGQIWRAPGQQGRAVAERVAPVHLQPQRALPRVVRRGIEAAQAARARVQRRGRHAHAKRRARDGLAVQVGRHLRACGRACYLPLLRMHCPLPLPGFIARADCKG
jgi:hypothetical protein